MTENEVNTPEKLKSYIELSKSFFTLEKNRRNLRVATHIILDFYKILLCELGNRVGEKNCENQAIANKYFSIRMHIPEFEEKEDLILRVEKVRNRISHNDLWFSITDLLYLIKEAEDFLDFSVLRVNDYCERGEKIRTLKDKVADGIYNVGFYIMLNEGVGYSEVLEEFKQKKADYETLDLSALQDKNLEAVLGILSVEIRRLRSLYNKAWENCPKCGGKIIRRTDSVDHYSGPLDDPEPYFETLECEKCGFKLLDEQETVYV